jgi:serine/threonine protein kinase
VGKLLGTGGSGELNSCVRDSELLCFSETRYSGSVYQGKDLLTGADVALKIGHPCSSPSRLSHEYNVYSAIAGSRGISQVHWYGKESLCEVIVLDHLGTSLGDLIDQSECGPRKTFSYAAQMVCFVM